jgi:predicted secreted protein
MGEDGSVYISGENGGSKNNTQGNYQYGDQSGTQRQIRADTIIDESYDNETIHVKINTWLQIELPGNGSQWDGNWNNSLVFLSDHYVIPSPTNYVGTDSTEVWLFEAHSLGQSKISFNLVYPSDLEDAFPRTITFIIDIYSDEIPIDRNASSFVLYDQGVQSSHGGPIRTQHSSMSNKAIIQNTMTSLQWGPAPNIAYSTNPYNSIIPRPAPVVTTGYGIPSVGLGIAPATFSSFIPNSLAPVSNNTATTTSSNTAIRSVSSNTSSTTNTSYDTSNTRTASNTIRTSNTTNQQYTPSLPTQVTQSSINSLFGQRYQFGVPQIMPSFQVMNSLMFMRMF